MTINLHHDNCTLSLADPSVIPAGSSSLQWRMRTRRGMNRNTLRLDVYSIDGEPLATTDVNGMHGHGMVTGYLRTDTEGVLNLFEGRRPDSRLPVCMVVSDAYRLWAASSVEMVNFAGMVPTPDPELVGRYVTIDQLRALGQLDDPTGNDIVEKINEILSIGG